MDSNFIPIHPAGWAKAKGYSNGMLSPLQARHLFISGQIAWDAQQNLVGKNLFPLQFEQALKNVVTIVEAAGGHSHHLARLTIYVTDKQQYLDHLEEVGEAYRRLMGKHYPAMALIQVVALLEPDALVEIEATAILS